MPKKPLRNRLDLLFQDFNTSETGQPGIQTESVDGWYIECWPDGTYVSCSLEVQKSLGVEPEVFKGKSLFQFHVHPDCTEAMRAALSKGDFPRSAEVSFLSANNEVLSARVSLLSPETNNGSEPLCKGFVQLMPKDDTKPAPQTLAISAKREEPRKKPHSGRLMTSGIALDAGNIRPSSGLWTQAGLDGLTQNQPVVAKGSMGSPAAIAVPFDLRDRGMGILEIVDDSDRRSWTDDDRMLAEAIATQLALALENASLYQAVQQELGDRIKAEQETLNRNQDLANLNQAGQQLSRLTSPDEIFDFLHKIISQMLGAENLAIVQFDVAQRTVSYPVLVVNGERKEVEPHALANDLVGYIFWTKKPVLITSNAATELVDRGITMPERVPASLIAIPMVTAERPVGAIVLQDFQKETAYDTIHVELLSTLASQATTALENANLFQEIRNALSAIENRERYQANVALVAATLSKYGSKSLPEVLASLGQASQSSRIYYAQTIEDEGIIHWKSINEWLSPDCKQNFNTEKLEQIPVKTLPDILKQLHETGWVAQKIKDLPSPDREFFATEGVQSVLILSVPGKTHIPGFIAFEDLNVERVWQMEEVRILQVATDALSNTILRENLLKQVQVSLHETENLYNLSHSLALANDPQEMVSAVAYGLQSPAISRIVLVTFDYNAAGKLQSMPVVASWHNGDGTPPPGIGTFFEPVLYEDVFRRNTPVFFDDITEVVVDSHIRSIWVNESIRAIAILPLWAGKRQTGVLLFQSEEINVFNEQIRRSAQTLSDQLATSVENMRLFKETEGALAETAMLYKVSSNISQATNPQELMDVIVQNLLPANADRLSIISFNYDSDGKILEAEIIAYYDTKSEYQRVGIKLPGSVIQLTQTAGGNPAWYNDVRTATEMDVISKKTLISMNVVGCCLVPLRSAGRNIGLIVASSREPAEFTAEEVRLLQVAGNGISIAVERQKLLSEAQRRAVELQTAAEIARDTTSTLSLDQLLASIVNLLCERFSFYHASIFLLDSTNTYAVVREATGEAGKDMKKRGHKLAVGSKSIIGTVTDTGAPVIINDTMSSPNYYPNPLLPETRAEMGIPLKLGKQLIGALDIQSRQMNAFTQGDVAVLQILADQIAIAIENARAYELSQKAVEDMREVDRMKSQFLANMSHELRTPLNSIIGFSRVIMKGIDGPVNETQSQDLTAIYNSGQHLLNLINDILDLSKIEAGKMELSFGDVNLTEMINSVMSTAIGLVKGKPVKLTQVVAPELPTIRADNTRVRQVLLNFISNAAKFTDEGTITVEAKATRSPTGKSEVMLTVTDTGAGIPSEGVIKLFQPFSQVDDSPTRKTGGTGLGLSICRSLIEMHGGRIGLLRSEVGVGSTFFFTLPMPGTEPEPEAALLPGKTKVILAIDDDAQVVSLYERYLSIYGYQVIAQTDPKKAVERAKEIHPAAITLDIMMPERDGWQVISDLKNDPETRDIPIIICSILEEEDKGFSLGAANYLVKPFAQDDLLNAINRLNMDGKIREVLMVDDSPDDLRLVQKMMEENSKYHMTLAEGGQAGWDAILAKRPDAIILDLFMPDLNGFEILERVRSVKDLRSVPVIILTGADLTTEQQKQLTDFGQQFITKGHLTGKDLLKTLENALMQYHLIDVEIPK